MITWNIVELSPRAMTSFCSSLITTDTAIAIPIPTTTAIALKAATPAGGKNTVMTTAITNITNLKTPV